MKLFCSKCEKVFPCDRCDGGTVKCPDCGAEITTPKQFPGPGNVIGDFLIEKLLSSGGMGRVFVARQLSLDRQVALKVLQGEYTNDKEYVDSLFREARAAAKINHPNIVQAYAVGQDDGVFYFAMELVRGDTMKAVLKRKGVIPFAQAAEVIRDIAKALDVAWREQKLVHQDIKPDNIMLDNTSGLAKLADLGIAKTGNMDGSETEDSDEVLGTPQYISPEQLTGVPTDVRSDIYSLGATFFQFVTGRFPYIADTPEELARMHDAGNLEPPRSVNPDVPETLDRIIRKMMARKLEDRYQTPAPLIEDLEAFLRSDEADAKSAKKPARKRIQYPSSAPSEPEKPAVVEESTPQVPEKRSKRALIIAAAIVGVLILLAGIGFTLIKLDKVPPSLRKHTDKWFAKSSDKQKPKKQPQAKVNSPALKPTPKLLPKPAPKPVPKPPQIRPEYQQQIATAAKDRTIDCEKFDSAWRFLSRPRSADEAALLAKIAPMFAAADEVRCAPGREALRASHRQAKAAEYQAREKARQEQLRQQSEAARKQREIERIRLEEAQRRQLRLNEIKAQISSHVRSCATAMLLAARDGQTAQFEDALQKAQLYCDTLTALEELGQKQDFAALLSAMRKEVKTAGENFAAISKVNLNDSVTFRHKGKRLAIVKLTPDTVTGRDDDDRDTVLRIADLDAKSRDALLRALKFTGVKNLEFYFSVYCRPQTLPDRKLAPAGFWQNCYRWL